MSESHQPLPTGRRAYRIAGLPPRPAASSPSSLAHVDDLVAAYALGALEPDEAAHVAAHVRGCAACEQALLDAQRTAGMLSFIVPLHTPPADSKAALFARVAHARKAAAASSLPTRDLQTYRTTTIPASTGIEDLVLPSREDAGASAESRGARSGWVLSAVSLPLLVALIATGFWGLQLRDQLSAQNSQLAELQSELTNFGSGTTTYELSPGVAAPQAQGQIVMGSDKRQGMVQIDVNTDDGPSAYEVWAMNLDGKLVPISEFTVNLDGKGQARFELDQPFSEYESVTIKAKPAATNTGDSQVESLHWDAASTLGSTGSGLDFGP